MLRWLVTELEVVGFMLENVVIGPEYKSVLC